ncbi:aromatic amino acid lyase [Xinfangfangia sp. D13-10-4-6]|uniref:aromatic amino acid lyase n=1 Tax=Pseudogemmobacter hezensis TaxID=2737662 RepID=UPI001554534C|nr:aromatic amino acid lyase [Pseudogemmobacter hezensis]NPD14752.1 aromatic amino acid lyase [Pseudogemmobacter hezensis]
MTKAPRIIAFDGTPLDMAALRSLLAGPVQPKISPAARQAVAAGRQVLLQAIAAGQPIYGATTGVGAMKNTLHHSDAAIMALNAGLPPAHQIAVGQEMPAGVARLTMALRLNTVLSGRVGVSEGFADHLAAMLGHDLLPLLHGRGSVGCADLGQMGELAAVMTGEGPALLQAQPMPAAKALQNAGLAPFMMQPRDALAAVSTNAFGLARAAEAVIRAADTIRQTMAQAAVTATAWGLDRAVWQAARASHIPGEPEMAAWLETALADQTDWPARTSVHDALSGRFLVQILAAGVTALREAAQSVIRHTAQIDDNPVICGDRVVPSGGSLLSDLSARIAALQLAIAQLGRNIFNRCLMLVNGGLAGLPVNLVPAGVVGTGYGPLMKLAQEQTVRITLAAQPVAPLNLTLAAGLEDEALLIPLAAERLHDQLEAMDWLLTIEALLAVQALALRSQKSGGQSGSLHPGALNLGALAQAQTAIVRRHIPPFTADLPLSAALTALRASLTAADSRAMMRAQAPFAPFDQEMAFPSATHGGEFSALFDPAKTIAPGETIQ